MKYGFLNLAVAILAMQTLPLKDVALAQTPPANISIAKATELAVHRIERLVVLKKIDPVFGSALVSLAAEPTTEKAATFKISGAVSPGADGKASMITIWQDGQGKTLAYDVAMESAPASPVVWPAKDAATLMEEGLHFILDGWAQYPEVKPYFTGLKMISMAPGQDAAGNLAVMFTATSIEDAKVLSHVLKPDGTFVTHMVK